MQDFINKFDEWQKIEKEEEDIAFVISVINLIAELNSKSSIGDYIFGKWGLPYIGYITNIGCYNSVDTLRKLFEHFGNGYIYTVTNLNRFQCIVTAYENTEEVLKLCKLQNELTISQI